MVSADARVTDVTISRVPNYRIRATLTIHREDPTGQDASGNWKGHWLSRGRLSRPFWWPFREALQAR